VHPSTWSHQHGAAAQQSIFRNNYNIMITSDKKIWHGDCAMQQHDFVRLTNL